MSRYFDLWAKTGPDGRWHGLPYHLLDVAATANALWLRLPEASRACPIRSLGDVEHARKVCVFLAGAHDVGKCNRYFQAKSPDQYGRLRRSGIDLPSQSVSEPCGHAQASGAYLVRWLCERWRWGGTAASSVAIAVGGHHGTFFDNTHLTSLQIDQMPWAGWGACLLDELAAVLGLSDSADMPQPRCLNPFLGWLAGFVSVADWLGSHETMTIWQTEPRPLPAYWADARARAEKVLDALNWRSPHLSRPQGLVAFLPQGAMPRSLQQTAADVGGDYTLAIIEAPTGEGKTEAAFALAEPFRSQGAGVYFALPTMATANGLYRRVEAYLRQATGVPDLNTRLLHSSAWLFRDELRTVANPDPDGQDQARIAGDWFASNKRGLLAPYGIGTIDQPLVAALRAKHGFVRLFALAGKVVVIDEVHAYDLYMADLMDVLLGWLAALNCRVVLLSATLPAKRREQLLRAWGYTGQLPASQYPSITWITPHGRAKSRTFDVEARKPLTLSLLPPAMDREGWQTGAETILRLVREHGGQGALVLNTVRDAQLAYDWLAGQDLGAVELDLFHARFTVRDRETIERRVLSRFGKDGKRHRPAILVATQVVEQSLDLDFDHMVTALAPIDLLIQRAGRLHRHRRNREGQLLTKGRDERPDPVLHILSPPSDEQAVPELREPMYADDVMLRTHRYLQQSPRIIRAVADVSQAVEAVYGPLDAATASEAWLRAYAEAERKAGMQSHRVEDAVQDAVIPSAWGRALITFRRQFLDDDENSEARTAARTRLEDMPSVTLVLLPPGKSVPPHEPTWQEKRSWVLQSVRTPAMGKALTELLELPVPGPWRRIGALRFARPVVLDEKGYFWTSSYEYRYSLQRGLEKRARKEGTP